MNKKSWLMFVVALLTSVFSVNIYAVEKYVKNGNATIEYSLHGKTGPLVVMIASTGRGTAEFEPLAEQLVKRGYRVALPEPRGIGGSHGEMDGVTFHDFANDFAQVVKAEGGKAIIAGHAYGNWIARTLAVDHPELVNGIVLVAAGAKSWPKELSDAITMINDPKSTREERLSGLRKAFFAPTNDPTAWLEGWNTSVTQSQRNARKLTNQADWWHGGSVPILDLQADLDPFRPESSRFENKQEFGDRVTVLVIKDASHALPAEKPLETANAIADWADALTH